MASILENIQSPHSFTINPPPASAYANAGNFQFSTNWQKAPGATPGLPERAVPQPQATPKGSLGILPSIFQFNIKGGTSGSNS